jgi:predicted O-methyltransferase YrrM
LARGLRHPYIASYYLLFGKQRADKLQVRRLTQILGVSAQEVEGLYSAIDSATDFQAHLSGKLGKAYFGEMEGAEHLYVIVRLLKPQVVVETGVSAGISTAYILKALHDEGTGVLYSIDLPSKYYTPPPELATFPRLHAEPLSEEQVGFAVPENLKERWSLKLGKSREVLPSLLREIGCVDMCLHDSEHSYETMMFEFATFWNHLRPGGVLLSHDISWNKAFGDFCKTVNHKSLDLYLTDLGVILK